MFTQTRAQAGVRFMRAPPRSSQKEKPLGSEPWFNPEGVTAAKVRQRPRGQAPVRWARCCRPAKGTRQLDASSQACRRKGAPGST
jgi:hypothetical protein